jgi:hypothetical protein
MNTALPVSEADLTEGMIRDLGDALTGPEVAEVWITSRRMAGIENRLERIERHLASGGRERP